MRHQPKKFAPPRSRRAREEAAPPYGVTDILKELWSDGWTRPVWAKLSFERGWMVAGEYYAIEPTERTKGFAEILYQDSPMFGLLKKVSF